MSVVPFILAFAASCAASVVIWSTRSRFLGLGNRSDDSQAVQSAHSRPTPRLGGLAVVMGYLLAAALLWPHLPHGIAGAILISGLPVFVAGLCEDLGVRVSPRGRLLAAAVSSGLAILITGQWISNSGVWGLDMLLALPLFAIPFTVLWGAGLCHAFNLIDGVNGLAGGTGIIISAGLAIMAHKAGDTQMMTLCIMLIPAILGYLVLNWPFGLIFMGDAGAYGIGHILVWSGTLVALRNPDVAGLAVVLTFFWPIADTFLAIYRRKRSGRPTDQPDRLHFHQLVMRALEILFLGRGRRRLSNPLTGLILLPLVAAPVVAATALWNQSDKALLAGAIFALLFALSYFKGTQHIREHYLKKKRKRMGETAPEGSAQIAQRNLVGRNPTSKTATSSI